VPAAGGLDGWLNDMRLGVLTSGRQDWDILRTTCRLLAAERSIDLVLLAGGMHLSARFGSPISFVLADGFTPAARLPWLSDAGDEPAHVQAAGALMAVADALQRQRLDALLLVGDRFETLAAGLAATLAAVPIVHLHGGEETAGAIDNACRDALTKLAHLHLVSHPAYRARVIAMGEHPDTVHLVGAPGVDNLQRTDLADRAELEAHLAAPLPAPLVLVTVHPTTLAADPAADAAAVVAAMDHVPATYIITWPNSDPGHQAVRACLARAVERPGRMAVAALGSRRFWGLLRLADAMLGNSSAGLLEAPAAGLPTINVGDRQAGRARAATVHDVPADPTAIAAALARVLAAERPPRPAAPEVGASARVVEVLRAWQPPRPPRKLRYPETAPPAREELP
jgi:UDP-hydrolysing UDP-N-acetyl-D-glucosamine 2-epimerase